MENKEEKFYIGNFKEEAKRRGGWFIGWFMKDMKDMKDLRGRMDIEIKHWEFAPGIANHEKKRQKICTEITLILKGKIEGEIDEERIKLEAGDYVIIRPQTTNGFPDKVLEYVEGLTIKIPSIEGDKELC